MIRVLGFLVLLALFTAMVTGAQAAVIYTVNGFNDTDGVDYEWGAFNTVVTDANEPGISDNYDIYQNFYATQNQGGVDKLFFAFTTYAHLGNNTNDYAQIMINADGDMNSGGESAGIVGLEYVLYWNLGTPTSSSYLQTWDGTNWVTTTPASLQVAKGTWGTYGLVEWGINMSVVPGWKPTSPWGVYLDGGGPQADDYSPDEIVPEPGTIALVSLGLVGLIARRRRQS